LDVVVCLVLIVVSLLLSILDISKDIAWLLGIISTLLALSTVSIKSFLAKSISESIDRASNGAWVGESIIGLVTNLPKKHSGHYLSKLQEKCRETLDETLEKISAISEGKVPLSEAEYFDAIIKEMMEAKRNMDVLAVNIIDPKRFVMDPREKSYFEENTLAIKTRRVRMRRVMLLDYEEAKKDKDLKKVVQMNVRIGIDLIPIDKADVKGKIPPDLMEDWVMFCDKFPRVYVDEEDKMDQYRVSSGVQKLYKGIEQEYRAKFERWLEFHDKDKGDDFLSEINN